MYNFLTSINNIHSVILLTLKLQCGGICFEYTRQLISNFTLFKLQGKEPASVYNIKVKSFVKSANIHVSRSIFSKHYLNTLSCN